MIFRRQKRQVAHQLALTYGYNYGEAIDLSQPDVIYQSINDLLPALGLPHSENQESKND